MRRYAGIIVMTATLLCSGVAGAQVRRTDFNTISWTNTMNTLYLNKKVSLWLEYQYRREQFVENWQQSLLRTGVQFHAKNGVSALLGYGYIITYPYGEYPAGPYQIPEHRIYEQLIWNGQIGRVGLNHRLRLEQRFVGKIDQKADVAEVTDWIFTNRVRYQLRAAVPLNRPTMQDKTWFAVLYDELFIGFGPNVNQNVFDQNRLGLMVGYQFSGRVKVEGGLLNQNVLQGALVGGQQVYQYNTGLIVNVYYTLPPRAVVKQ